MTEVSRLTYETFGKPNAQDFDMSDKALEELYNRSVGELDKEDGYNCPLCKNRGYLIRFQDGEKHTSTCSCMNKRIVYKRMRKMGLFDCVQRYTFERYQAAAPWQAHLKQMTIDYVKACLNTPPNKPLPWLYLAGQPGCGKTHLCHAVLMALAEHFQPHAVSYPAWYRDVSASAMDKDERDKAMRPCKNSEVLFMDDLFRSHNPTNAEIQTVFEVVNHAYGINRRAIIFSSEMPLDKVLQKNEGLGRRMVERCGEFTAAIRRQKGRDYSLRSSGR